MSKIRVIFRADSSKKIGFGHLYRSLAMANHLKDEFECLFSSFNHDATNGAVTEDQLSLIASVCWPLPFFCSSLEEFNDDFLKELRPGDIVVLDNYYYTTEYQKAILDKGCKLVCIDDMHDHHMVCDLLITGSPLHRKDFSLEPYTEFRSGIEWIFLRDEFLSPQPIKNVSTEILNIAMAMGGSDAFNITDKMIDVVKDVLPHVNIDVIAGSGVTIANDCRSGVNVHRNLTANQLVRIFDNADLGIFPASTIAIEALSRKMPVIAGIYADNQKALYEYGVKNNLVAPLGSLLDDKAQIRCRLQHIIDRDRPLPKVLNFRNQKNRILDLFKQLK